MTSRAPAAVARFRSVQAPAVAASLFCALAITIPAAAAPDAFDATTRTEIQSVITEQLDAFEKGDARRAEDLAAPGIRRRFPEPSLFLDMVREGYGALIHPKSTQFTETLGSPHGPLQKMTIVAADGTVWIAIYSFQKVEGRWRITACGLQKDVTQQDI